MINSKKIRGDIIKLLDNLSAEGYIRGKIEINFDIISGSVKIQIHEFEKKGELTIRKTVTIN